MTEDDTFRILARTSYQEMEQLIRLWYADFDDDTRFESLLKNNGWTVDEWNDYKI